MIYPLLWLVASSFKSNDTMFKNTYSLLPESWGIIKNYNSGFASTAEYSFGHFFMNSAIVTVIGVVCTIFSFLLAAYAVSRVKFFGANFWFGCIIMTMMMPAQVMVVPQYIILKKLHLNDTLLAMILPWAFGGAFFVFLIVDVYKRQVAQGPFGAKHTLAGAVAPECQNVAEHGNVFEDDEIQQRQNHHGI